MSLPTDKAIERIHQKWLYTISNQWLDSEESSKLLTNTFSNRARITSYLSFRHLTKSTCTLSILL